MVNYTYAGWLEVPGIEFNGTVVPAYHLPNGTLFPAGFYENGTQIALKDCTFDTCNLEYASQLYVPNWSQNIAFAVIFGVLVLAHIPLAVIFRTWGFSVAIILGLVLELVGYIGRLMMHENFFSDGPFIIYICCLTIAPAFLTAAIYLCFGRIMSVFGSDLARFRPFIYTVVFMFSDFVSLVLQGAGGGLASTADDKKGSDLGINIMIAGLVFQVVSLLLFITLCSDFAIRVWRRKDYLNPQFRELRDSGKFKLFLTAQVIAIVTILVRSVYRVVELKAGFHSELANHETTFLILESVMIGIACIAISAFHPGLVYGRQQFAAANFKMNQKRGSVGKSNDSGSSTELQQYREV